jgi:hypothetical protein
MAPTRANMMAPSMPPTAAPTTAVCAFSFLQSFTAGAAVASKGVPVATAVAVTRADGDVDDVEDGVAVAAAIWSAPMEETVALGALSLLQQLSRSLFARQQ